MSLGMNDTTETSVMVSLNELVSLENERVQEERIERQRIEHEQERVREVALARAHAEEEARKAAEAQARADAAKRAVEQDVRLEALRQAEVERARIEAKAAADQELAEARHRHEQQMLKLDTERKKNRLRSFAAIGVMMSVLVGGFAVAGASNGWFAASSAETDARLRDVSEERQRMLDERVGSLDRFRDTLRSKVAGLDDIPRRPRGRSAARGLGAQCRREQ